MISQEVINRIEAAVNIVDVVRDFEPNVRKHGVNYTCLCPFHRDKSVGSFFISPRKNMCYCFSCEKGGDAVYYLMEAQGMSYPDALRYLGRKYDIPVEGSDKFTHVPKSRPRDYDLQPDNLPVFTLPRSMYERSTKGLADDVLVKWIRTNNWTDEQRGRIDKVLRAYCIGTATTEHNEQYTVFWYLDEQGRLCTGKMIRYKYNGHRMKKEDGVSHATDWIHAWLYRSQVATFYDREKVDWKRTYFGMHLVDTLPEATVNIVESEKTALLMAIAYGRPDRALWLACGSKTNLTRERLMPLMERGRSIVLYPDRDGIEAWRDTARAIGYEHLSVNADPVTRWWREEDGEKADIADVVLRIINNPPKTTDDVVSMYPGAGGIVERLDLELIRE